MPIPLLVMFAGGGALWAAGHVLNNQAAAIEAEAEQRQQAALAERQRLICKWEAEKQDFEVKIRGCCNIVKVQHDYTQSRAVPVFDCFGYPVGDVSKFPLPPGMEWFANRVIEPMMPRDIPGATAYEKQLGHGMKSAAMAAQGFPWNPTTDPTTKGAHYAVGAGMAHLKAGMSRKERAAEALTAIIQAEARTCKLTAEKDGFIQTHSKVVERGRNQCATIIAAVKFVTHYADICDGYIMQGRTRQTITADEFENVKRLASAVRIVNEIARQAVA